MNTAKSYAVTFLSFGAGLIGLSLLTNGWSKVSLITLGVAFTITAILFVTSLRFRPRWLVMVTERIGNISVCHLTIFLILYGFAIALIQNGLVRAGIISIYAAYITLGLGIGRELGSKVLRPILIKLNS